MTTEANYFKSQKQVNSEFLKSKNFKVNDIIGRGSFGQVYQAQHVVTKEVVAIKAISKSKLQEKYRAFSDEYVKDVVKNEIKILQKYKDNQNIVKFIHSFSDQKYEYIVTQKCDGSLKNLIDIKQQMKVKFTEQQAICTIYQICKLFKVLSENNVLHRDIKPENILLQKGVIKVSDFGIAKQCLQGGSNQRTNIGTQGYMPPQMHYASADGKKPIYSQRCDVWALGCLFYEIFYSKFPWTGNQSKKDYFKSIEGKSIFQQKQGGKQFLIKNQLKLNDYTIKFINKCLTVKQLNRPSWDQLFQFQLQFFKKAQEIFKKKGGQIKAKFQKLLKSSPKTNKKKVSRSDIRSTGDTYQPQQEFPRINVTKRTQVVNQVKDNTITTNGCQNKINTGVSQNNQQCFLFKNCLNGIDICNIFDTTCFECMRKTEIHGGGTVIYGGRQGSRNAGKRVKEAYRNLSRDPYYYDMI